MPARTTAPDPAAARAGRNRRPHNKGTRSPTCGPCSPHAKVAPAYVLVGYSLGGWNVHGPRGCAPCRRRRCRDGRCPAPGRQPAGGSRCCRPPLGIRIRGDQGSPPRKSTTFDTDPTLNPGRPPARRQRRPRPSKPRASAASRSIVPRCRGHLGDHRGLRARPSAATLVEIWWDLPGASSRRAPRPGRLVKVENATHEMPFERAGRAGRRCESRMIRGG